MTSLKKDLTSLRRRKVSTADNSTLAVWGPKLGRLFYPGKMLQQQWTLAVNSFFIKKVKDIIAGNLRLVRDLPTMLPEQMAAWRCTLRLVTEDKLMKVTRKIKPTTATGVDYIDNCSI